MQGNKLLSVHLFDCEVNSSQILGHFPPSVFFFLFYGLFLIFYQYSFPLHLLSQGWQCNTMPSAFGSHLFPPEFFGFDPSAAGLPCMSPSALALYQGRSLSVWEGYIHWLVPAGATRLLTWSGAVTRRRPAGASVPAV